MYRGRRDLATHLVHREPARASLGILKPMPEESTPPDLVELVFAPAFRLYEAFNEPSADAGYRPPGESGRRPAIGE